MISVITSTIRDHCIDNVFDNFNRQDWEEKELIIILNQDDMDSRMWFQRAKQYKNVSVFRIDQEATLGDCLNYAIERSKYDYIAKFDDDDYYSAPYLRQAINAIHIDDKIGIVGKNAYYIYFEEQGQLYRPNWEGPGYTDRVGGPTLFFKKEVWKKVNFRKRNVAEDYFFINDVIQEGYKVYSTDSKYFALIRRNEQLHTWKQTQEDLKHTGTPIRFKGHFSNVIV